MRGRASYGPWVTDMVWWRHRVVVYINVRWGELWCRYVYVSVYIDTSMFVPHEVCCSHCISGSGHYVMHVQLHSALGCISDVFAATVPHI